MKKVAGILIGLVGLAGVFAWTTHYTDINPRHEVGDVVDTLDGVFIYYNGSISNVDGRNTAPDGYNLGLKYQCVEFVKRYYYEHLDHKMPNSWGHAVSFYDTEIQDGQFNQARGLTQYSNGSTSKPEEKDLIVFEGTTWNPYGHVAIVSEVGDGYIEIAQQNPGPLAPSRERLNLTLSNGKWKIEKGVLGWLRK